jgi:hypothetical protein
VDGPLGEKEKSKRTVSTPFLSARPSNKSRLAMFGANTMAARAKVDDASWFCVVEADRPARSAAFMTEPHTQGVAKNEEKGRAVDDVVIIRAAYGPPNGPSAATGVKHPKAQPIYMTEMVSKVLLVKKLAGR